MERTWVCVCACESVHVRTLYKSSQHKKGKRQSLTGSLSEVLSRLAVEVRVDGEGETIN